MSNSESPDNTQAINSAVGDVGFQELFGDAPKVLWVASAGGHLAEAHRIEGAIGRNTESMWVTFDVPQSQSLLAGRRKCFADYVAPRDVIGSIRASGQIARLAADEKFDLCISTGAALAGVALPRVAFSGVPTYYVESIARSTGPSLTGKLMNLAPRVRTLTQYRRWANASWPYAGSILDHVSKTPRQGTAAGGRKIFVTLGTIRPYRFDRAVDAVLAVLRADDEVTWQLGTTQRADLPGTVYTELPGSEMQRLMEEADVVVVHSGVGSILMALGLGKIPVLAVRERAHREHIDDHQWGIADVMTERGLAYVLGLDAPDASVLSTAQSFQAVSE